MAAGFRISRSLVSSPIRCGPEGASARRSLSAVLQTPLTTRGCCARTRPQTMERHGSPVDSVDPIAGGPFPDDAEVRSVARVPTLTRTSRTVCAPRARAHRNRIAGSSRSGAPAHAGIRSACARARRPVCWAGAAHESPRLAAWHRDGWCPRLTDSDNMLFFVQPTFAPHSSRIPSNHYRSDVLKSFSSMGDRSQKYYS